MNVTFEDIKKAALAIGINLDEGPTESIAGEVGWVERCLIGPIGEGRRDDTCTALAGHYLRIMPKREVEQLLRWWADNSCDPPFEHDDVLKCLNSIAKKVLLETEAEFDASIWQLGNFLDNPPPEIPELVQNWARIGDLTLLVGMGGIGKTSISLPMAFSAAAGVEFIDYAVEEPMRVFYMDLEIGPYEMNDRLKTLAPNFDLKLVRQNLYGACLSHFSYLEPSHRAWLHEKLDEIQPKILFIDNHSRFYTGEPNSEADMKKSVIVPLFKIMEEYNMAVVYLMHTGWKERERPRGTAAIFDAASTVVIVQKGGNNPLRNRVLHWTKNRPVSRERREDKVTILYDPTTQMLSPGGFEGHPDILASIKFPILKSKLAKEMAAQLGIGSQGAYRRIADLIRLGDLEQEGNMINLPVEKERTSEEIETELV